MDGDGASSLRKADRNVTSDRSYTQVIYGAASRPGYETVKLDFFT